MVDEPQTLMDRPASVPSMMAGPLRELAARFGLGSVALGLAIAGLLWAVLMLLAAAGGMLDKVLSLSIIAGHVRILIAIPLMLACEGLVEAALGPFVRGLVASRIVSGAFVTALQRECDRFNRLTSSRLVEGLLLLIAMLPAFIAIDADMVGSTAMRPTHPDSEPLMAGYWYWFVCLPLFRFMLMRALFRLGIWYFFLWRLSRMELNLIPTHPDRVAGLAIAAEVQLGFVIMAVAFSAVVSAGIAELIVARGGHLQQHYGTIVVMLLACAALLIAPLYMFSTRLWLVRLRGRAEYSDLSVQYVSGFDAKWLRGTAREGDLLGSPDLQSLADLGNSVKVIDEMKLAPVTLEMVLHYAAAVLVPMLPLLLFEFPLQEIAGKILEKLLGG